jgi:hypothetical protein
MMNRVGDGRVAEGGGESPSALGDPGRDGGILCAASWMSINAVTAFATTYHNRQRSDIAIKQTYHTKSQLTMGFPSPTRSRRISTKPHSTQSSGLSSKAFATQSAAVFRT